MDASASLPALPRHPEPVAELVVVNGRLGGARRPLSGPLTLLGQGAGCDLRLLEDDIALFHCAIVIDAQGPLLRDLGCPSGTRINGKPVETHRLANGDRIEIGGVAIDVALETPTAEPPCVDAVLLDHDREGLRIQVAAVAAQQAALDEVESKLDQRQVGLDRQETQLARHLDERRQQLEQAGQALEHDRAALQAEREGMARDRAELVRHQQESGKQRERLQELRRRLGHRYEAMGRKREAALQRQEAELAAGNDKLRRERASVQAFLERINGELELGRQQMREQRQILDQDRAEHESSVRERTEAVEREQAELARQALDIARAREALAAERQAWELRQTTLSREAEGLEARIRATRERLEALGRDKLTSAPAPSATGEVIPPPMSPALQAPAGPALPQNLRDFAALLAEQRSHLLGQWRQLLDLQEEWQEERRGSLAELERVAEELAGRELDLGQRQRQVAHDEAGLTRGREELAVQRASIQGWRSRLAVDEAACKAQQQKNKEDLTSREALLEQRREQLEHVNQRRNARRKQEVAELLGLRGRCEEARRQFVERWQELDRLRVQHDQAQRELAAHALAVEQARDEVIHASPDSVRAVAQIERLRKRERAQLDAAARDLEADRLRLHQDLGRSKEDAQRVRQREEELLARQLDLTRQIDEWEGRRADAADAEATRQEELRRLRARHAVDERQLRQLREELERLASLLIEEGEPSRGQAA